MKFEKKQRITWKDALLVALAHVALGWSAMRLLAFIEVGFDFEKSANMRIFGAVFLLPLFYYLWARQTKRDALWMSDISAICTVFGCISGRLNCLTSGCCRGMLLFSDGTYRWPIRELELAFYVLFIAVYSGKIRKRKTHGEVYPIYMIAYGILRFLCEFVREEFTTQVGVLHLAHIWALVSIATGTVWLCILKKRQEYSGKHRKTDQKNP